MTRWFAAIVAAILVLVGAATAVGDPALEQLRQGPVYVSPAVTGAGTPDAVTRLTAVAAELAASGRPVRIVVVKGPVGAVSMRDYAVRLRAQLGFDGMVVAVAPGRAVGAAGARSQGAVTRSLRNAKVGAIADPVERAAAAARAAAGPPLAPSNSDLVRAALALLGIALVGGTWAAAFGIRRANRRQRLMLDDRSALARVTLDAIGARLDIVAGLPDDHARADDRLDAATRVARRAQAELDQAASAADVLPAEALVHESFMLLREAEHEAGVPSPIDPFEGLCRADPAHGAAAGSAPLADGQPPTALCSSCMARVRTANPPQRRMVPGLDGDVPYDSTQRDV
jgi:hypothetical protein